MIANANLGKRFLHWNLFHESLNMVVLNDPKNGLDKEYQLVARLFVYNKNAVAISRLNQVFL